MLRNKGEPPRFPFPFPVQIQVPDGGSVAKIAGQPDGLDDMIAHRFVPLLPAASEYSCSLRRTACSTSSGEKGCQESHSGTRTIAG